MATRLVEAYGGEVPGSLADLTTLPGVGRKTGNVVRSVALGLPGLPVDTHVTRLSQRLGLTTESDPVKIELALNAMIPAAQRGDFSLRLILHGRRVCAARRPACDRCVLVDICPSARLPVVVQGERAAREPPRSVMSMAATAKSLEVLHSTPRGVVSIGSPGSRHLVSAT